MSCREPFFQKEVERILSTWATKCSKNVDVMYYDGGWENPGIKGNHIMSTANDSLDYTFLKTWDALYQIVNSKKYDWILRVNTSTYINIPLLEKFVNEIAKPDVLYAAELYSLTEACCPEPLDIYARGNAFLISWKTVNILLLEGISMKYMTVVDDVIIGNILNTYYIKRNENYLDHIKGFPHAWYRTIDKEFPCGHSLSTYGKDGDMNYYNDFISIQTKMYRRREKEADNMMSLWNMMKDAPEPSLNVAKEYIKNPSIFIGSALGYISYDKWIKIPKNILYNYEMNNKAIDDKQSKYFSQEAYNRLHSF